MKKMCFFILTCLIGLSLCQTALATKYNANAGCAPDNAQYNNKLGFIKFGSALDINNVEIQPGANLVQYIWAGPNGMIDGPGLGGIVTGDDQLAIFNDPTIGNDNDCWQTFANTPGKFFHYFKYETNSAVNKFYVRIWDKDPAINPNAMFRESLLFAANSNPDIYVVPNNVGLSNLVTIFPQAQPEGNININPPIQTFDPIKIKWNANFSWNALAGTRSFKIYSVDNLQGGNPQLIGTLAKADGQPYEADNLNFTWPGLNQQKSYFVQVEATNTFGGVLSPVTQIETGKFPDLSIPYPVTDLKAAHDPANNTITLTWSVPYDRDNTGALAPCIAYDIRVVKAAPQKFSPIDIPVFPLSIKDTNPDAFSNWDQAISITAFPGFQPAPIIPQPILFGQGQTQSIVISGNLIGTYFFAMKARDDEQANGNFVHWSYISNVAGVKIPDAAVPKVNNVAITFGNAANQVTLAWETTAPAVDIYSSVNEAPYALAQANVAAKTIDLVDQVGTIFYRIVPKGELPVGAANGTTPAETVGKKLYSLNKKADGYGINLFSLPFKTGSIKGKNNVLLANNSLALVQAIVAQQAGNAQKAIESIGYWDNAGAAQKAIGFVTKKEQGVPVVPNGNADFTAAHAGLPVQLSDVLFVSGLVFQINVNSSIQFELAGNM